MTLAKFVEYIKIHITWKNKPDQSTPVDAAAMMKVESGIKANNEAIQELAAAVVSQIINDPNKIASMAALFSVNEAVAKLNIDLATHIINNIYPDVGITEPFAQLLNMWNKLPEDAPFIGVYNNYGIRFYYGYIYSGRESGSIMLHDFSGRIIILSKVNGVFTKRYISTSIAE